MFFSRFLEAFVHWLHTRINNDNNGLLVDKTNTTNSSSANRGQYKSQSKPLDMAMSNYQLVSYKDPSELEDLIDVWTQSFFITQY